MRPDRRVLGQPMRKLLLLRSCEVRAITTCLQLGCKFQRILGSSSGLAYHCPEAEEGQDVAERIQPLPIDHSRLCPIAHIYLCGNKPDLETWSGSLSRPRVLHVASQAYLYHLCDGCIGCEPRVWPWHSTPPRCQRAAATFVVRP